MHPSTLLLTSQVCYLVTHILFIRVSSGVNGVANVSTNSENTVLQWDQMANTDYPDCITSYSIGWSGMTYNTNNTSTLVTREILSASGFPFCTTIFVTVTPVTPMRLLAGRDSTADVSLISPGINKQMHNILYYILSQIS